MGGSSQTGEETGGTEKFEFSYFFGDLKGRKRSAKGSILREKSKVHWPQN